MSEWRPIESAPKDGMRVILYWPDYAYDEPEGPLVDIGSFVANRRISSNNENGAWAAYSSGPRTDWLSEHWTNTTELDNYLSALPEHQPTHWMPLPSPPKD